MNKGQLAALGVKPYSFEGDLFYTHSDLMKVCAAYEARISELKDLIKLAAEPDATQDKADVGMCAQWDVDALLAISQSSLLTALEEYRKNVLIEAASKFEGRIAFNFVCADDYSNGFDIGGELRYMAEEAGK